MAKQCGAGYSMYYIYGAAWKKYFFKTSEALSAMYGYFDNSGVALENGDDVRKDSSAPLKSDTVRFYLVFNDYSYFKAEIPKEDIWAAFEHFHKIKYLTSSYSGFMWKMLSGKVVSNVGGKVHDL